MNPNMEVDDLTELIIGAAIRVHQSAGPKALESTYHQMMEIALRHDGLSFAREVPIHITFEGETVHNAYRMDLLVEGRVPVEIKSVEKLGPIHFKQLLTYLRHTKLQVGLLLNFQEEKMKDGVNRLVNQYRPPNH